MCEAAVEISRLSGNPHYLVLVAHRAWLGATTSPATSTRQSPPARRASGSAGACLGGNDARGGGGPGWALAVSRFETGDLERRPRADGELGGDDMGAWIPVERFFNWENLALRRDRAGQHRGRGGDRCARRGGGRGTRPAVCRRRWPRARRPWCCSRRASSHAAADAAQECARRGDRASAHASRWRSRERCSARYLPQPARRHVRSRRCARPSASSTPAAPCGCATRRGASCASSARARRSAGRRRPRSPAIASLTKREREIADLVTDRLTNRQIAETLFLSAKTVESHIRNLFMKLGASSRVEVARIVERERREST